MSGTYEQTRADLRRLLDMLRTSLPVDQVHFIEEFIEVDEYELALECMLDGLIDVGLPLPPDANPLARELASRLDIVAEIAERLARLEWRR